MAQSDVRCSVLSWCLRPPAPSPCGKNQDAAGPPLPSVGSPPVRNRGNGPLPPAPSISEAARMAPRGSRRHLRGGLPVSVPSAGHVLSQSFGDKGGEQRGPVVVQVGAVGKQPPLPEEAAISGCIQDRRPCIRSGQSGGWLIRHVESSWQPAERPSASGPGAGSGPRQPPAENTQSGSS